MQVLNCTRDRILNIANLEFDFEMSDFFKIESWKAENSDLKFRIWKLELEFQLAGTVPEHTNKHGASTVLGRGERFSGLSSDFPYLIPCMLAGTVLRTHKAKLVGLNASVEL